MKREEFQDLLIEHCIFLERAFCLLGNKCDSQLIRVMNFSILPSGVVRGVAGVAKATPIFQILFYKIVTKISQKFFYLL